MLRHSGGHYPLLTLGHVSLHLLQITGDIAVAAWQFWRTSGDTTWLTTDLEPLLRGAADFYASRAEAGADGKYHLDLVMSHCTDF